MSDEVIRIVIVDDQWMIREGLATLASTSDDIEVVATGGDGVEAIELTAEHRPDVVLMDIRMPNKGGIEAAAEIRRDHPKTQVLMLTTFEDADLIERSLDAGAVGYLTKDIAAADLASAIRSAVSGVVQLSQGVTRILRSQTTQPPGSAPNLTAPSEVAAMPPREREVLQLLVEGKSNREIANELHLSAGTVKNHVSSILRRLGTTDRTNAAVLAVRLGIVD
ncbi:MAG: response regulator transcription factor [Actinomycetota bacterium]